METKVCSSCKQCKPVLEFHKHSRTKDGLRSQCRQCVLSYSKNYYNGNTEARKLYDKEYRKNNPDKVRIAKQEYQKNNRGKVNAINKSRKLSKKQRTPAWLDVVDTFEIECIYTYCAALRNVGLVYEVDHIIPLSGENVSGLHVPSNLSVIPMMENRQKYNKFEVLDAK